MSDSKQQFAALNTELQESDYDLEQLELVKENRVNVYVGSLLSQADADDCDGAGGSKEGDPTWQDNVSVDINATIDVFNQLDVLNKAVLSLIADNDLAVGDRFKNTEDPNAPTSSESSTAATYEKISEEQEKKSEKEYATIKMEDFREPPVVHKWCVVKWIYVVFAVVMIILAFIALLQFFLKE